MRRAISVVFVSLALGGCGGSGIEGVLAWDGTPRVAGRSLDARVRNTTSHSEPLSAKSMRLLNARGQRVPARIHVGVSSLAAHSSTSLTATWKAGDPVRIDYGLGTLPLRSG